MLARSSLESLLLFVSSDSASSHEFASQFGLAFFYTRKTPKNLREDRPSHKCLLNERTSDPSKKDVNHSHGGSIASDNMSGDNSNHSGDRLSQNGDNESLYLHVLKNVVKNYYVAYNYIYAFVVCTKINNEELFLRLSRLKIHVLLFLDRLRRGA